MLKVMVVEDEELIRKGIVLAVDWASLDCVVVCEAANGEEGLEVAAKCSPGLIITDLKMPEMDGLELIRFLKEKEYPGEILVLSNYEDFDSVRSALLLGAADYLLKIKIQPDTLLACLNKTTEKMQNSTDQKDSTLKTDISEPITNHLLSFFQGEELTSYRQAVEKCKKFCTNFKTSYQNLFFYGTVGTGKTFLTNCIAKECIEQGCSVLYFSAASLFDLLARNTFDYRAREELSALCADLYGCDLLVIDDLGTETATAVTLSHFFTCLNERLLRQKSVIISTNLSLEDCRNRYQDRIFSRIASNFEFCKLTGPDIRMCKKVSAASGPVR